MLLAQLQAPGSPVRVPCPNSQHASLATTKGHICISKQEQALPTNGAQINNIQNLCPLFFIHCGAFVGFSLVFNEATVSRKGEKRDGGKSKGRRRSESRNRSAIQEKSIFFFCSGCFFISQKNQKQLF